jgi:5S rRNA maturation endonuclease (ribonuclease M5)
VAGRQARNVLNKALPECWHAFVPSPLAVAAQARGYKEIGNVGVEHAPPRAVMEALKRRRKGIEGRNEFNKEKLYELGLVAAEFERVS